MLDLAHHEESVGFRAVDPTGELWVMAEVTPSCAVGFWHVTVVEPGGVANCTVRPVRRDFVEHHLRRHGAADADFRAVQARPTRNNPWCPSAAADRPEDARDVYFIQGVDGGPIKIGVAADPVGRLASIQLMSPMTLRILGLIRGAGQPEERRLHKRFAAHRSHGEWFRPAVEITDFIKENS